MHGLRFPSVLFARATRLVETADGQHVRAGFPATRVHLFQLGLDTVGADTGNARVHTGEVFSHHRTGQANGFKVQTAAIGRQNRDAHL